MLFTSFDYLIYTVLKSLYIIALTVALVRLSCTSELLAPYKRRLAFAYACMALTLAKDAAGVFFYYRK